MYLCIEMSGKGSISRMSDECLMKQEMVISFYVVYQADMRKFTLAGKTLQVLMLVEFQLSYHVSCTNAQTEHR